MKNSLIVQKKQQVQQYQFPSVWQDVDGFISFLGEGLDKINTLWLALLGQVVGLVLTFASMLMTTFVIYQVINHNFNMSGGIYEVFGYSLLQIPLYGSAMVSTMLEAIRKQGVNAFLKRGQQRDKTTVTIITFILISVVFVSSIFYYYDVSKNTLSSDTELYKKSELGQNLLGKIKTAKKEVVAIKKQISDIGNMKVKQISNLRNLSKYSAQTTKPNGMKWAEYNRLEVKRKANLNHLKSLNKTIEQNNKSRMTMSANRGQLLKQYKENLEKVKVELLTLEETYVRELEVISGESANKTFWAVLTFIGLNLLVELGILFLFNRKIANQYVNELENNGDSPQNNNLGNHQFPTRSPSVPPFEPFIEVEVLRFDTIHKIIVSEFDDKKLAISFTKFLEIFNELCKSGNGFISKGDLVNPRRKITDNIQVKHTTLSLVNKILIYLGILKKWGKGNRLIVEFPQASKYLLTATGVTVGSNHQDVEVVE